MTTEKRKHLAAWFSIIFIFVTLAFFSILSKKKIINAQEKTVLSVRVFKTFLCNFVLGDIVRYLCGYRNFVIHTCRNTGWLDYRGCRYGSILYQLCSRTDDGEKMI